LKRHVGAANVTGGVAALAAVVNTAATISAYPAGFTNLVKYLFAAALMTLRHSYRLHPNRVSTASLICCVQWAPPPLSSAPFSCRNLIVCLTISFSVMAGGVASNVAGGVTASVTRLGVARTGREVAHVTRSTRRASASTLVVCILPIAFCLTCDLSVAWFARWRRSDSR
jgi:hypothetical protein